MGVRAPSTCCCAVSANPRIPLFDEEKQQKTLIHALRGPKVTLQVIDFIRVHTKFRYAAEQRNFLALQRN